MWTTRHEEGKRHWGFAERRTVCIMFTYRRHIWYLSHSYVNMDYFFLTSLKFNTPARLVVSYDIACQWSRNLSKRVQTYPTNPLSSNEIDLTFLVPKFHLPAHIEKCQTNYSFNLVPGVGRTDGEAPECGWADINSVATRAIHHSSNRNSILEWERPFLRFLS